MMNEKIKNIKALLEAASGISDYRINTVTTESNELFFVHRALETVRATDTTDTKVTVFVANGDKLGDATFSIYASYDDEKIKSEIEAARKKAALIDNESYPLPEKEIAEFDSDSNFKDYDIPALAAEIAETVFDADHYDGGSINALEVFIYRDTVSVINSRGVEKTQVKYRAMVEAIPTYNGTGESVELYECVNFTEFDKKTLLDEIESKMREVRDRLSANKPDSKLSARVVLPASELSNLIAELSYELSYSKMYSHANAFSVGDEIQKAPKGDTLTVTMRGAVRGSVRSDAFDGDGFTLVDRRIIENGRAVDAFGSVRYAHYLGKEPTGSLRCVDTEGGTMSDAELASAPYFKCVSMSGLQLDIYNDYIGGEVRLAYYFDGEREIPVTGISISGKLSDALSNMRLSDEITVYESYKGPKFAAFDGIEIV